MASSFSTIAKGCSFFFVCLLPFIRQKAEAIGTADLNGFHADLSITLDLCNLPQGTYFLAPTHESYRASYYYPTFCADWLGLDWSSRPWRCVCTADRDDRSDPDAGDSAAIIPPGAASRR